MRIEYVSKLMGHASIKTTQVYAKIVNADLDKAMEVFDNKPVPPIKPESKVEKSKWFILYFPILTFDIF